MHFFLWYIYRAEIKIKDCIKYLSLKCSGLKLWIKADVLCYDNFFLKHENIDRGTYHKKTACTNGHADGGHKMFETCRRHQNLN